MRRLHEYFTLLGRNFRVLLADRFSLWLTIGLAPMIAFCVFLAFKFINKDTHTSDNRIFAAQLFFDTMDLTTKKMPAGNEDASPALFSYPGSPEQAMKDFQDDFILYEWYCGKNQKYTSLDTYRERAAELWLGDSTQDTSSRTSVVSEKFVPTFTLLRYDLPFLRDDPRTSPYVNYDTMPDADSTRKDRAIFNWPLAVPRTSENQVDIEKIAEIRQILARRADAVESLQGKINSEESTRSHMTVFFILIAAAIWMGLLPACKEIVADWDVFLRESRCNISSTAFLFSKFTMLAIVTAIQNAILVGCVCCVWLQMSWKYSLAFYLILVLTSNCAAAIGLLISSFTTNLRQGLMIIPIVMIVQLILGGLLRLPAQTQDTASSWRPVREAASKAMIQYWAFEAVTGVISRLDANDGQGADDGCEERAVLLRRDVRTLKNPGDSIEANQKTAESYIQSENIKVDDYIFDKGRPVKDSDGNEVTAYGKPPRFLADMTSTNDGTAPRSFFKGLCKEDKDNANDWARFVYHVIRPLFYLFCTNIALLVLTCLRIKLKLAVDYNGGFFAMLFKI